LTASVPRFGRWWHSVIRHSQNHVHRDVKPANILFDRHGNAFLGDFGIIKALTTEATDWRGNSLTAPGFLVGTPNYVAPEVVMGRTADGRVDQYSLAMTVYEILTGNNCMEGPTPSATVVNLLNVRTAPRRHHQEAAHRRNRGGIQRPGSALINRSRHKRSSPRTKRHPKSGIS
jgi:serine/threonine protein kinase